MFSLSLFALLSLPVLLPELSLLSLLLFESLFDEALVTVTFVLVPVIMSPALLPSASPTTIQYAFIVQLPAAFAVNENDCDVGYPGPAASPIFTTPSPPLLNTLSLELEITTVPKYPDGMETVTLTVFPTATELELTLRPSPCAYTCSAGVKTSITATTSDNTHPNNFFISFLTFLILRYL